MPDEQKKSTRDIEVKIYSLATMMNESIIFLEEIKGDKLLPIWIGTAEGQAIAIRFSGIVLPRPLTHDMLLSVIKTLGFTIEKVVVSDLKENTFYASIYLKNKDTTHVIDSRPSDALAVAVRSGCRIFVNEKIFAVAQVLSKPITEDEVKHFKEELKNLKPKDIFNQLVNREKEKPPKTKPDEEENDE